MTAPEPNLPTDHPVVRTGGLGVLLVNLGTPDAPTPAAVKRYLAEFLSDRRVVEIPPLLWQPTLRGIILKGAGLAELWPQLLGLLVLGLVFNLLAAHNTRKAA